VLSVPVQVIAWKGSSLKLRNDLLCVEHKTTHSLYVVSGH